MRLAALFEKVQVVALFVKVRIVALFERRLQMHVGLEFIRKTIYVLGFRGYFSLMFQAF